MAQQIISRRRPRIVDRRLQLALLWKAVVQWALFTLVAFGVLLAWEFLAQTPGQQGSPLRAVWERHGIVFLVLVAMLPAVVYDSFKFSHRLAGPMVRLRHTVHCLAKGERVESLKFRQRDYWHDLADDFNVLLARLQSLEDARQSDAAQPRREAARDAGRATEPLVHGKI